MGPSHMSLIVLVAAPCVLAVARISRPYRIFVYQAGSPNPASVPPTEHRRKWHQKYSLAQIVAHPQPAIAPISQTRGRDEGACNTRRLPLKKMTECSQWLETVANDLGNCQHGHREDAARNTPHPEPEDE